MLWQKNKPTFLFLRFLYCLTFIAGMFGLTTAEARLTSTHSITSPHSSAKPTAPAPTSFEQTYRVKKGETLSVFLQRVQITQAIALASKIDQQTKKMTRRLFRRGRSLVVHTDSQRQLQKIEFLGSPKEEVFLTQTEMGWQVKVLPKKFFKKISFFDGEITSTNNSVYLAIKAAGLGKKIVDQVAEILGWKIEFTTDVRVGDKFKIFYEELYYKNTSVGYGSVLSIAYTSYLSGPNNPRIFKAFLFHQGEEKGYFDENGNSVEKQFLRYPLKFSRISSSFGVRWHPISKKRRAHKGIDFAARRGTPVIAVADGIIIRKKRSRKGYGNYITVAHTGRMRTLYAHLQGFKRGLRRGQRVRRGQVIGYVGSTGYATGPHLHYELIKGRRQVNPSKARLPNARNISPSYKKNYLCNVQFWNQLLDLPTTIQYSVFIKSNINREIC